MPVRFNCPVCSQLLGIGSRKIGSVIFCPKCQGEIIVPTQEQALAEATELDRFDQDDIEETLNSLVVYDQVTVSPAGSLSSGQSSQGPLQPGHKFASNRVMRPASELTDEQRYVAVPRSMLYVQGVLFAGIASAFFGAGYWIGSAPKPQNTPDIQAVSKPATARLNVRLTFLDSKGTPQPDRDSVVMALPVERSSADRLLVDGLRPSDPSPSAADSLMIKLERQGIAYGRTNATGELDGLIVAAGQKYHLLILSNHAQRPKGTKPRAEDLKLLDTFFEDPAKLLGERHYYLGSEVISNELKLVYEFGKSQR